MVGDAIKVGELAWQVPMAGLLVLLFLNILGWIFGYIHSRGHLEDWKNVAEREYQDRKEIQKDLDANTIELRESRAQMNEVLVLLREFLRQGRGQQ